MPNSEELAKAYITNRDIQEGPAWSEDTEKLVKLLCKYADIRIEEAQKDLIRKIKDIISKEIDWCVNQNNTPKGLDRHSFAKGLEQAKTLVSGCLLPEIETCPFCGISKGRLHLNFDYVECPNCGSRGQIFDGHPYDAVQVWNSLSKLAKKQEQEDNPEGN